MCQTCDAETLVTDRTSEKNEKNLDLDLIVYYFKVSKNTSKIENGIPANRLEKGMYELGSDWDSISLWI